MFMHGKRRKVKEIRDYYKGLSDSELLLEKENLLERMKSIYIKNFDSYKSKGVHLVMYKNGVGDTTLEVIQYLGYEYIIKDNDLFVKLRHDVDFENSIENFLSLRKKWSVFNLLSFVSSILTILVIIYGIINNVPGPSSNISLSLCVISILFSLMSRTCLRDSKKIGVYGI